jgi:hypothetical protein
MSCRSTNSRCARLTDRADACYDPCGRTCDRAWRILSAASREIGWVIAGCICMTVIVCAPVCAFRVQMDIVKGSVVFNDLEINVDALNATLLKNAAVLITSGYIKKATAQISCVTQLAPYRSCSVRSDVHGMGFRPVCSARFRVRWWCVRTHVHTHARTHSRTHTHARTHARTHACASDAHATPICVSVPLAGSRTFFTTASSLSPSRSWRSSSVRKTSTHQQHQQQQKKLLSLLLCPLVRHPWRRPSRAE